MTKLLVNAPSGKQEVFEIGAGGGYFDQSLVLWDERVDGLLPDIALGGMVRVGAALEFNVERLAETKSIVCQARWEEIKIKRDRIRFTGGVPYAGNWYLSTATATSEYNSLILMSAGLPGNTVLRANWRTMNGAEIDMTPNLAKAVLSAGFAHLVEIDDAALAHKAAMEASADPASYDFSGGWPDIYEP